MNASKRVPNRWQEAYDKIQNLILNSQIKPGEQITEIGLSERLSIGRTPVREALRKLEQEGLIVTRKGRKRVYHLTLKEIEEIFDIKIVIEGAIARWAAEKGTEDDFKQLLKIIDDMKTLAIERPKDEDLEEEWFKKWLKKDEACHHLLYEMAANNRAEKIISQLNKQWHRLKVGSLAMEGRIEKSVVEHENIVQAIVRRDALIAKDLMELHLTNLKKTLLKMAEVFGYPEF